MYEICRQANVKKRRGKQRTKAVKKGERKWGQNKETQHALKVNLPTYIEDVKGGDVRGGGAQLICCFHPDLVRGEKGKVVWDVTGVLLVPCAVILTLLLSPVPPGTQKHKGKSKPLFLKGQSKVAHCSL